MSAEPETISFNGREYSTDAFAQASRMVWAANAAQPQVRTPGDIISAMGKQYGGDRDTYEVLGYPDEIEFDDYNAKYRRGGLETRVIKLPAEDSWRHPPLVTDDDPTDEVQTEFEAALEMLVQQTNPWHYIRRADVISGIGEYGLLFIGFADDAPLDEPVEPGRFSGPEGIEFYSPFSQGDVSDWRLGKEQGLEPSDERYNLPVLYEIDFSDPDADDEDLHWVHWTRVLHIAEGKDESDVKGTPRLRPVYNRFIDLEKTLGASAEMYWVGADRKLQFNIDAENTADIPESQLSTLDDEVQKLVHEMQNYIKTFNTDIEVIGGEDVNPSGVVDEIMKAIAGSTGIPKRILTGSERGELASSQDRATWFGRVETRQNTYVEPGILRPFIDRLIAFGVLPEPLDGTYDVDWPNLFELNEVEKSEVQANRAQVLERVAPQGNTDLLGSFDDLFDYIIDGEKPDFGDFEEISLEDFNPDMEEEPDEPPVE